MTKEQFANPKSSYTVKILFFISELVTLVAFFHLLGIALTRRFLAGSIKWQIGLMLLAMLALIQIFVLRFLLSMDMEQRGELDLKVRNFISKFGLLRIPLIFLLIFLPEILFLKINQINDIFFSDLIVRIFILWIAAIALTAILLSYRPQYSWIVTTTGMAVLIGFVYRLGLLAQEISTYPFSLGWSEASRYYYASLFFARRIYGFRVPPSVLHPTRYLLQSVPFLIPGLPLVAHRIWQVLLWLSTTVATGYLLARRVGVRSGGQFAAMIALTMLYLFQGPVYYHLLVMVILVLWLFDGDKPWRSLGVILLASTWAGISRINWYPVPAMLGAALYLLEIPRRGKSLVDYVKWPAVWFTLGTATAFISQVAYIAWSGQPASQFSSSFSSGLLWYRLLPNATYPLGVLLAVVLASLPALLLFWFHRRELIQGLSWTRSLGLAAIMLVLLAGGLIVSVKIGGGSNLHNLDAYLVILGVIAAYLYVNRIRYEDRTEPGAEGQSAYLLPFMIAIPLIFTLSQGRPVKLPGESAVETSLEAIRAYSEEGEESSRQILFISQRHLLTFDTVTDVKLVPDYETVFLMEMAMSGNEIYLSSFHSDLAKHRFDVIVVDPLATGFQGRAHGFGEENDAWVREVSIPMLCYYEVAETFSDTRVQILHPREISCGE